MFYVFINLGKILVIIHYGKIKENKLKKIMDQFGIN